jgi:CRP-like cAMP-binding protein
MRNPWLMKMELFTRFSAQERQQLDDLVARRKGEHGPGEDIIREGDHSPDCHVILSGLACRYKHLPDGGRQIMAFLIPGDLCDAEIFILKEMDHSVAALTPTITALISGDKMKELLRTPGCVAEALWWGTMTDLAVLRERIVDHGRRDAHERLAHLLYEMLIRYRMIGEANDDEFEFAITQNDLADATGMTAVHANRAAEAPGREADYAQRQDSQDPRYGASEKDRRLQRQLPAPRSRQRPARRHLRPRRRPGLTSGAGPFSLRVRTSVRAFGLAISACDGDRTPGQACAALRRETGEGAGLELAEAEEIDEGLGVGLGREARRFGDLPRERVERCGRNSFRWLGPTDEAQDISLQVVLHRVTCYKHARGSRRRPSARAGMGALGGSCIVDLQRLCPRCNQNFSDSSACWSSRSWPRCSRTRPVPRGCSRSGCSP